MSGDCEQIQFYIQQQLDVDLSFEDEQAIMAHLDSCNLCNRYRSQIEQVIVFAQDLPLSEEYLPAEYETLVGRAAEQLPKPSLSPLDLVLSFFGKVLGLGAKGTSIIRSEDTRSKIPFPHINRVAAGLSSQEPAIDIPAQLPPNSKGLGKKFGIEFSEPEPNPTGAVTLAETIRQNVSSAKTAAPQEAAWRPLDSLMPNTHDVSGGGMPADETPPGAVVLPAAMERTAAGGTESSVQQFVHEQENLPHSESTALAETSGGSILGRLAEVLEDGGAPTAKAPDVVPATPVPSPAPTAAPPPIQTTPVSPAAATKAPDAVPATPVSPPAPATPVSPVVATKAPNVVPTTPAPPVAAPPPPAAATKAPTTPAPPATAHADESAGLLKNVRDEDIDTIFTQKLGVAPEAVGAVVNRQTATPTPPPTPPPTTQKHEPSDSQSLDLKIPAADIAAENIPAKTEPQPDSLFSLDDEMMDKIFTENLGIESAVPEILATPKLQEPVAETTVEAPARVPVSPPPSVSPASPPPSARTVSPPPAVNTPPIPSPPVNTPPTPSSPPPVEVEGLGRLDSHAGAEVQAGPSQIGAIGKFLLDRQDIQNLEKLAQSNLADSGFRVLTPEASQDLQALLQRIKAVNGVTGSVIVGHDGIVVSSDLPNNFEAESIAVWSLGIYLNTDNAIKKMGRNSVQQLLAQTPTGYLTITDFGAGILATITEDAEMNTLLGVVRVATELMSA